MVFDLFSKRQRQARGEVPDVFTYDKLPDQLKGQIYHIAINCIGYGNNYTQSHEAYDAFVKILREERGVFSLIPYGSSHSPIKEFFDYFMKEDDIELALDCVEIIARAISNDMGDYELRNARETGNEHINIRFREHGIGYQVENGLLIRVDSEFLHQEAVKPALSILHDEMFAGANEEFTHAFEHYKSGSNKSCLVECLKAIESTIKIVLSKNKVPFSNNASASKLISLLFDSKIIPDYMQTHFNALRSMLESGVPTIRNKLGGHGQGEEQKHVPAYLASYALHLTASTVLLIVNASSDK